VLERVEPLLREPEELAPANLHVVRRDALRLELAAGLCPRQDSPG
jgi:hypothetical protein